MKVQVLTWRKGVNPPELWDRPELLGKRENICPNIAAPHANFPALLKSLISIRNLQFM